MTVVRKSELARRLGVSRPRVSQFVALGLPVRHDGRIDLERACEWVLNNVIDQWTDDASPAVRAAEQILSEI
jgi:DNA-binding transcriptional regulator YdaS (Cro superfamily)